MKNFSENEDKELQLHIVYAGYFYQLFEDKMYEEKMKSIILNKMKKNKIKSVMFTSIWLHRLDLVTKETMESYCKDEKDSVNDDLKSLFENIRLGENPNENVETYFLPKLTKPELKLVEKRDTSYFQTFAASNPDVDEKQMMLSESDSKYVNGLSWRSTFLIENFSKKKSSKNKCFLQ